MSLLYIAQTAPNHVTRRGRAYGWYQLSINRSGRQYLLDLLSPLRTAGIRRIYADDFHTSDARAAAEALGLPLDAITQVYELRPFNVGRNHSKPEEILAPILDKLIVQWRDKPDIPIRGGDSWTSYQKRFIHFVARLLDEPGDVLLLTDARGIRTIRSAKPEALAGSAAPVRADRVYTRRKTHGSATTTNDTSARSDAL